MRAIFAISSTARRIWHWLATGNLIELTAFDKLHAEVARAIAFADFVDGNDTGMIQAGGGFRFPAEALQMRVCRPMTKADDFKRDGAIQTLLACAEHHTLTATADFLKQFVIAEILWAFPLGTVFFRHATRRSHPCAMKEKRSNLKPVSPCRPMPVMPGSSLTVSE